jgi:hypothetical protein
MHFCTIWWDWGWTVRANGSNFIAMVVRQHRFQDQPNIIEHKTNCALVTLNPLCDVDKFHRVCCLEYDPVNANSQGPDISEPESEVIANWSYPL